MRAARKGDECRCPKQTPGEEIASGDASVLITGRPAARHDDVVDCEPASFVMSGGDDVEIGGRSAARQWDATVDQGVIATECDSVLIQPGSFDPVAAAIARIRASAYGQTWEGQMAIRQLERLHRRHPSGIEVRERPDYIHSGEVASYDRDWDKIYVWTDDGGLPDVEKIASPLVHEAHHAEIQEGRKRGRIDPSELVNERYAWDQELEFYEQQKKQGDNVYDPKLEEYGASEDHDAWLEDLYKNQPGFTR